MKWKSFDSQDPQIIAIHHLCSDQGVRVMHHGGWYVGIVAYVDSTYLAFTSMTDEIDISKEMYWHYYAHPDDFYMEHLL